VHFVCVCVCSLARWYNSTETSANKTAAAATATTRITHRGLECEGKASIDRQCRRVALSRESGPLCVCCWAPGPQTGSRRAQREREGAREVHICKQAQPCALACGASKTTTATTTSTATTTTYRISLKRKVSPSFPGQPIGQSVCLVLEPPPRRVVVASGERSK